MFKTNFYIATLTAKRCIEYQQETGRGELFEAPDGTPVSLRFDRRTPKAWRITEESTGYAVNGDYYSTRAEAVRSITPEFAENRRSVEILGNAAGCGNFGRLYPCAKIAY